jgi:hypothetical protein
MTRSTASTAMGDMREEYWDTTLLLKDLWHPGEGGECSQQHTRCRNLATVKPPCHLPAGLGIAHAPAGRHRHPQALLLPDPHPSCWLQALAHAGLLITAACLHGWVLLAAEGCCLAPHVLAALISASLSSRLTGMAMDSRICRNHQHCPMLGMPLVKQLHITAADGWLAHAAGASRLQTCITEAATGHKV